jgi:alpha-D-ribose 1-methylphosphonate 5-triphosphate synthase subunit PhnG
MIHAELTPETRAALLAQADRDALTQLAEEVLASAHFDLVHPPETGTILLEVREPVAEERFHVGEALVTRATVAVDGAHGWAMRLGDDREATLAAAICDAAMAVSHPLAERVRDLCHRTEVHRARQHLDEQSALAPTGIRFDELD